MGRIFGTDGARGIANTEISCTLAMDIGRAAAMVVSKNTGKQRPLFLVGSDTRISRSLLESAVSAGTGNSFPCRSFYQRSGADIYVISHAAA